MKYLVIAEKPSVARSISKVIGAYKHEDGYRGELVSGASGRVCSPGVL